MHERPCFFTPTDLVPVEEPDSILVGAPSSVKQPVFDQPPQRCGHPSCDDPQCIGWVKCCECNESMGVHGSHRCVGCERVMHGICGQALGDEGYGQQRKCSTCVQRSDLVAQSNNNDSDQSDDEFANLFIPKPKKSRKKFVWQLHSVHKSKGAAYDEAKTLLPNRHKVGNNPGVSRLCSTKW
jgi:hypothetical protein